MGSYYNIPKAIFYLVKEDDKHEAPQSILGHPLIHVSPPNPPPSHFSIRPPENSAAALANLFSSLSWQHISFRY